MPGMATLFRRVLPRAFGTLRGSSNDATADTDDTRTYDSNGRKMVSGQGRRIRPGSSSAKNISMTTDIHVSFGSGNSERVSKDDDYELLSRMPSETPLRPPNAEVSPLDNKVHDYEYPRAEQREYRQKW
jgi:hypothetical protein